MAFSSKLASRPADEWGDTQDLCLVGVDPTPRSDADLVQLASYAKVYDNPTLEARAAAIPAVNEVARIRMPEQVNSVAFEGLIVAVDCAHDAVTAPGSKTPCVADLSQTEFALPRDFDPADLDGNMSPYDLSIHHLQIVPDFQAWLARARANGYVGHARWHAMLRSWDAVRDENIPYSRFSFGGVAITQAVVPSTLSRAVYAQGTISDLLTVTYGGTVNVRTYNSRTVYSNSTVYMDYPTPEEQAKIQTLANHKIEAQTAPRMFVPWVLRTAAQLEATRPWLNDLAPIHKQEYMTARFVGTAMDKAEPYDVTRIKIR